MVAEFTCIQPKIKLESNLNMKTFFAMVNMAVVLRGPQRAGSPFCAAGASSAAILAAPFHME
jgi:hypothetical protein